MLPACRCLLFPRATKEIGDVCTQASEHEMHILKIIIAITGLSKNLGQDVRIEEPYWRHSLLDFWPMLFCPPSWANTALPEEVSLSFACLFLHTQERLCMNQVRSLLSMRSMLLAYNLELRPNNRALATAGSVVTIGLTINGCSH